MCIHPAVLLRRAGAEERLSDILSRLQGGGGVNLAVKLGDDPRDRARVQTRGAMGDAQRRNASSWTDMELCEVNEEDRMNMMRKLRLNCFSIDCVFLITF